MYNPLDDLDIMALTVWAEARGESKVGQKAVAWVIRNRYENPGWWSRQRGDGIPDDTIAAVCLDPYQFSCWNLSDPNRFRLDSPKTKERSDYLLIKVLCKSVLESLSYDDDPTFGSDHYCKTTTAKSVLWAKGRKPVVIIGKHSFYRIELSV